MLQVTFPQGTLPVPAGEVSIYENQLYNTLNSSLKITVQYSLQCILQTVAKSKQSFFLLLNKITYITYFIYIIIVI